jgi:hypothetical protein
MSPMSSAILYLAIIAIWAGVLIPRWLKRDSARGSAASQHAAATAPQAAATDAVDAGWADRIDDCGRPLRPLSAMVTAEDSRRRMLAARRRLLLMLLGLEVAAVVLALTGLAAVWVVFPPSIMLSGYLLLLREAAKADAERTQREAEAASRAAERARSRALAQRATPAQGVSTAGVPVAAAALAAKFAAAPVPADYEDGPGRDFAPGLAGKYTTSNSGAEDDDYYYDSYEPPRLRAVGD